MKSYTSIVNHMFNNNLPDIILPDDKNIGDHSSIPASLSSSTQTPSPSSSTAATAVSKSSYDAYHDLKEIAFPNQIHRSFSDIVSKLGMYVYTCLHTYPSKILLIYLSCLSIYNLYINFNVCLIIVPNILLIRLSMMMMLIIGKGW